LNVVFTFPLGPKAPNSVIQGSDGNFYGTTVGGGRVYTPAMVFKASTNGVITTLAIFYGTNGLWPQSVMLGSDGNIYGITSNGGITNTYSYYGLGTIFKLTTNGTFTSLVSFTGTNGSNLGWL